MRRGKVVAVAVVAVVLVVTVLVVVLRARGEDAAGPPPAPPAYDPPHRFDAAPLADLPREADGDPLPVALEGFTAFVAVPGRLQVIDTRSGSVRAEMRPQGEPAIGGGAPGAPVLARRAGQDVVVAGFPVTVPGHGTTVGHDAVELVVLERTTLERLPPTRVDLPAVLGDTARLRAATVIAGAPGTVVVVARTGTDREPATYTVDLATGAVRWRSEGFAAVYAEGGLLIGVRRQGAGSQVQAVSAADAGPAWTVGDPGESVTVSRGGRAFVAVVSVSVGSGRRTLTFYDTLSGRAQVRRTVPGGVVCRFDDQLTTVCWTPDAGQAWAAGFDAATARLLWELPDASAGRVAPRVSTVWHGVVYGTTDNGPVVLRAPSGEDWPGPAPNVAPHLVNDVVGVVGATIDRPRPRVYRAAG
jgi:hypothetical protein